MSLFLQPLSSFEKLVTAKILFACRVGRLAHCHQLLWDELMCDMGYSKYRKVITHTGTAIVVHWHLVSFTQRGFVLHQSVLRAVVILHNSKCLRAV